MTENPYVDTKFSNIHRRGAFAKQDIPKGTRIIEYLGEKITKAESTRRALKAFKKSKKGNSGAVYIFTLNKRYDIDGEVSWNTARLINHGCWPNCESELIRGHIWIVAKKKIRKGEELLYDYGFEFNVDDFADHPCHCGHPKCRGYIVRRNQYHLVKKALSQQSF